MGLFNFFKKTPPTHQEKVNMAYRCYKPEFVEVIFPGKQIQASNVIISLAKLYNINLDSCDARKYHEILTTYSDVVIRRVVTQSSNDHIFQSLQVKHGELVKNKELAMKVLAFVTICMNNQEFVINSDEDMTVLDMLVESYIEIEETAKENAEAETANLDDPEYGLVASKPIYTSGVGGSHKYLDALKTTLGEELTWERVGTTSAEGINGIIDIYTSKLPSGQTYKTLYVNMYGSKNSTKIPKGFRL